MGMPAVLKNFAVFVDGTSYAGEVDSVTLPKLKRKMEEFRAGGMRVGAKVDMGMEALEADISAGGWLKEVLKQWGAAKADGVPLRFAGAVQADDSGDYHAVEVYMRGRWEELDMGDSKAGDKSNFKAKMQLTYYRLVWDGEDLIEIDALNLVEKVGGNDITARVRDILGI